MAEANQATSVDEVALPDPQEILDEDKKATEAEDSQESQSQGDKADNLEKGAEDSEAKSEAKADGENQEDKQTDEQQTDSEEVVEEDPAERARRGYADRHRMKEKVTQALATQPEYTPQTAEELEAEGKDPALAQVEALRQSVELDRIVNQLTELNATVNSDANAVLRDFPIFDPQSKDYDKQFTESVANLYMEISNFQVDEKNGIIVNASYPLYKFYEAFAGARSSGMKLAAVEGQKAAEQQLSASETPSSEGEATKPTKEDSDPFLAGLMGKASNYAN